MPVLNQGSSVDLNVLNTDSSLTIQNAGGWARVEAPIGVTVWEGGGAQSCIDVKNGTCRITAITRGLEYQLSSDAITASAEDVGYVARGLLPAKAMPLPRWRKALGDALAGIYDARVMFLGDSTTAGIGTAGWSKSVSSVFSKLLSARGIPVNANACFGDATRQGGASYTTFDPRIGLGSGWTAPAAGFSSLGGTVPINSSGAGAFNFTPTDPVTGAAYSFDTINVFYCALDAGGGTFTISVDGGAAIGAAVATTTGRALAVATRSTSLGAHTVNINATVPGSVYLIGILVSNSATKTVRVLNVAGGSFASSDLAMGNVGDYTLTPAATNNVLTPNLAPHLSIVDIGINNRNAGTETATYERELRTLFDRLTAVGSDIVMCIPAPTQVTANAYTVIANQLAFDAVVDRLAGEYKAMVYRKRARLGSWEAANPIGMYADFVHPSSACHASFAVDLVDLVLQ